MSLHDQKKRVEFGEDWVDVRKLSVDEIREARAAVQSIEPLPGEELLEAQGIALLQRVLRQAVIAWSDDMPINEATIKSLPYDVTLGLQDAVGLGDREAPLATG